MIPSTTQAMINLSKEDLEETKHARQAMVDCIKKAANHMEELRQYLLQIIKDAPIKQNCREVNVSKDFKYFKEGCFYSSQGVKLERTSLDRFCKENEYRIQRSFIETIQTNVDVLTVRISQMKKLTPGNY
jgi:hypothetical protein